MIYSTGLIFTIKNRTLSKKKSNVVIKWSNGDGCCDSQRPSVAKLVVAPSDITHSLSQMDQFCNPMAYHHVTYLKLQLWVLPMFCACPYINPVHVIYIYRHIYILHSHCLLLLILIHDVPIIYLLIPCTLFAGCRCQYFVIQVSIPNSWIDESFDESAWWVLWKWAWYH